VSESFPDALQQLAALPDGTVLDGELLVWPDGATQPAPFAVLQRRLNRKVIGPKLLAEAPVRFVAYDLLEDGGVDLRALPQHERRARLEALVPAVGDDHLQISPLLSLPSWEAYARLRAESRSRGVEGFMLKRRDAHYGVGRTKESGTWWKWKIDPFTVDTVLIYAHPGHGRRASLFTDYTFAVWHEGELVPIAKAYSGLSDAEIQELDAWIRRHTRERFGPTRLVEPVQVFELAFEGIARSSRHRSGIAVRFPRILRWRKDKPVAEADSLPALQALVATTEKRQVEEG